VVPDDGPADAQREGSMLDWYRSLIELRRNLRGSVELLDAAPGVVAFRRGSYVIAINLGDGPQPPPAAREIVLAAPASNLLELAPGGCIVAVV